MSKFATKICMNLEENDEGVGQADHAGIPNQPVDQSLLVLNKQVINQPVNQSRLC